MYSASLIFFYMVPASLIFIHGIGLERLTMSARSERTALRFILKNAAFMLPAASLCWLFMQYILAPIGLLFLTPLFSALLLYFGEHLTAYLFRTPPKLLQERLFSYGAVLFALYYAFSYWELLIIILSACAGMMLWTLILYAITLRIDESKMSSRWKNAPLLLIAMGIIALSLYAWDNAWIMPVCNLSE